MYHYVTAVFILQNYYYSIITETIYESNELMKSKNSSKNFILQLNTSSKKLPLNSYKIEHTINIRLVTAVSVYRQNISEYINLSKWQTMIYQGELFRYSNDIPVQYTLLMNIMTEV